MSSAGNTTSRRGFTLIEACMAIVITSILLVGMGSAITMTISAAEAGADGGGRVGAADDALARLRAELSTALTFRQRNANIIEFEVPDRDADGDNETIAYTWSGRAGDALKRRMNDGADVPVLLDVRSIDLRTIVRNPPTPVESAEASLMACEDPTGASVSAATVDAAQSVAQYLRPTLPANTASWKVTRVRVFACKNGAVSGSLRITIQTADAARKPSGVILASATLSEAALGAAADWVSIPITAQGLSPGQGVCIVLDSGGSAHVALVTRFSSSRSQPYNAHYLTQAGTAAAWSTPDDNLDLKFTAYGTVTTNQEIE